MSEADLHPSQNDADDPQGDPGPALVIDESVDLDAFLPESTLFVHLSLEQFLRQTRGAGRVEGVGPVTLEQAIELLMHTRVRVTPVVDLHETWAVDGYRTPPRMREHVELRYPVEVFPHGTLDSRRADKGHPAPYRWGGPPGQTSTDNLAPSGDIITGSRRTAEAGCIDNPGPGCTMAHPARALGSRRPQGTHHLGRRLAVDDQAVLVTEPADGALERAFAALIDA